MELTKLKIELYDVAAIVIPGIFCLAEVWAALFGAQSLLHFLHDLKGTELSLVVLCSFALGNLVQEAGNRLLTAWKGSASSNGRVTSFGRLMMASWSVRK